MVVNRWEDAQTSSPARPKPRAPEGITLQLEGKRLDDWLVGEYLDEGAFGIVHRATHRKSGETAALKILKPEAVNMKRLERFQREGIALMRVEHPNVVQLYGTGRAEIMGTAIFYIALELLEGKTLEQEIAERGRLPEAHALHVAAEIVKALIAVGEQRIVHGDLKPSNVYLTNDGRVKVMDFGHSTLLEFDNLTKQGAFVGTAPFAAPEQFVDSSQVDSRADQYSLGCLLYFMLTGVPPYPEALSMDSQSRAHQFDMAMPARRRNSQITSFASAFTARLMAKRKHERFAQLQDIAALLTSREQSNFFTSLFPEFHRRSDSAAFWSTMVFPRFPQARCPADPPPALTTHLLEHTRHFRSGKGVTVPILSPRGQGTTRAVFEAFSGNKDVQLVRGRMSTSTAPAFSPIVSMLKNLFPNHQHAKFAWEEQFRFLTKQPPDGYATLRMLLKDPAGYEKNFGTDRDLKLVQELALVLGKLSEDLPLVLLWDHGESYDPRLIQLMLKLIPKLEASPVMNLVIGLPPADPEVNAQYPTWAALIRSLERQCQRLEPFTPEPLDTSHLQRLMGHFLSDEGDLRFLIQATSGYQFQSYRVFFAWLGYWIETLHMRKMQIGRPRLTPGDYGRLRDPLITGSLDQLLGARFRVLSPLHQRALTIMAEEGEFFDFPKPHQFKTAPTSLELTRMLMELERRWYITLYRDHGHFRGMDWVDWIREHPVR